MYVKEEILKRNLIYDKQNIDLRICSVLVLPIAKNLIILHSG